MAAILCFLIEICLFLRFRRTSGTAGSFLVVPGSLALGSVFLGLGVERAFLGLAGAGAATFGLGVRFLRRARSAGFFFRCLTLGVEAGLLSL